MVVARGCASTVRPDASTTDVKGGDRRADLEREDGSLVDATEESANAADSLDPPDVGFDALPDAAVDPRDARACVFPGFDAALGIAHGAGPCTQDATERCSMFYQQTSTQPWTAFGSCDPYSSQEILFCLPQNNSVAATHAATLGVGEYVACCGNELACGCRRVCVATDGEIPHCVALR